MFWLSWKGQNNRSLDPRGRRRGLFIWFDHSNTFLSLMETRPKRVVHSTLQHLYKWQVLNTFHSQIRRDFLEIFYVFLLKFYSLCSLLNYSLISYSMHGIKNTWVTRIRPTRDFRGMCNVLCKFFIYQFRGLKIIFWGLCLLYFFFKNFGGLLQMFHIALFRAGILVRMHIKS